MVSIQNKVLRVSFRSEAQATDSTCNGCRAKRAAMNALGPMRPVISFSDQNSNKVFAMWSSRFVV